MGKSQESFSKKEKEKKKQKKKEEKLKKKQERKANASGGSLDDMIAYVDEYGNILDSPPDPQEKEEINAEDIVVGVPKKEEVEDDGIYKGRLAFFNDSKGYGFINDAQSGEKYFVHISECLEPIAEGDVVVFEVEQGPKGLNAVRVKKA